MSVTLRDYSTISPSALSLLLMKSQTSIPYARQAADLLWGDSVPSELAEAVADENARRRLRHFANRYFSLDQLLAEAGCPNVLELGAGLSFRGLDLARRSAVYYLDTDLPEISALKATLIAKLEPARTLPNLRVAALNALDDHAFQALVDSMPSGRLAIVNEGLLVYLSTQEKVLLAKSVRRALARRGGVWLTGDIYVRNPGGSAPTAGYGRSREFLDRHRVEQNKFSDFAEAARFFSENGFRPTTKLGHEHPEHIRQSWALELESIQQ